MSRTITVIGDGLAGTALALTLAAQGAAVRLIGAAHDTATALSYGAVAAGPPSWAWQRLERLHGPLGWRPSGLVLHDARAGLPQSLSRLSQWLPLPLARIDTPTWMAQRQKALAAAGVHHLPRRVDALRLQPDGAWGLELAPIGPGEAALEADIVVLAAGAGCRALWPALPPRFRHSWAGVLQVPRDAPANPWLDQARRGRIVQPSHWRRPALEAASATTPEASWIVDAGLAPWGQELVVGQISWIPPAASALDPERALEPPDPQWMEERLREGLSQLDPQLAALAAPYRQVPVSFCSDGQPLVGPVADAPGLWLFAGFSAAFSRVPSQAEALAPSLLAAAGAKSG
ncbi:MAG: FAD-dependent oxidoreductase [Cyanobacteriota bacterium]|nr:FAD-dependent oxidoreductase [Cyanobacteriota bacterium]